MSKYIGTKAVNLSTTSADVTGNADIDGNLTVGGNLTVSGTTITVDHATAQTVDLGDNDKIRLGADYELQLWSDGTTGQISGDINHTGSITTDGLTVDGSASFTSTFFLERNNPNIRFDDSDSSNNAEITLDNTTLRIEVDEDNTVANSAIKFQVDGSLKAIIDDDGNFGLGINSPTADIHLGGTNPNVVFGTSGNELTYLQRYNDDFYIYNKETAGNILLGTANQERLRVTDGGDVSIGSDHSGFSGWRTLNIRGQSTGGILNFENNDGTRAFAFASQGSLMRYQAQLTGGAHKFETNAKSSGAFIITDSGNVGVGAMSPTANLSIHAGSATGTHLDITTTGNGHNFDMVDSGGTARFRNVGGVLRIGADHDDETAGSRIQFEVDGVEHMRVASDGKVGIGTANPQALFHAEGTNISAAKSTYSAFMFEDDDAHIDISSNEDGSWGSAVLLKSHASNGNHNNTWAIARNTNAAGNHLNFNYGTQNDHNIGNIVARLNTSGDWLIDGGIYLGGDTAAANKLDDYEEGNAALTISGSSSGSTTYAQNDVASRVRYTKIGRFVHASFLLNNQAFPTFAGDIRVNLPFTSSSGAYEQRSGDVYFYNSNTWDNVANFTGLTFRIGGGASFGTFGLLQLDANRQTTLGSGNTSLSGATGIYMRINITYETPS